MTKPSGSSDSGDSPNMSRRDMLGGGFLSRLAKALGDRIEGVAAPKPPSELNDDQGEPSDAATVSPFRGTIPVIRPPGAVDEPTFLRDCTRCDECLIACPHDAIVHAPPRFREAAGTPMIESTRQPCWMCEDLPCITACEPGVLSHAAPVKIGEAHLQTMHCLAHREIQCTTCSEQCPVEGAIEVVDGRPRIVQSQCTGCGVCHYVCPSTPNSILILPLKDRPPAPSPD